MDADGATRSPVRGRTRQPCAASTSWSQPAAACATASGPPCADATPAASTETSDDSEWPLPPPAPRIGQEPAPGLPQRHWIGRRASREVAADAVGKP